MTSISRYFDKNLTISTSLQALQMKGLWWDIDSSLCWPKWNSVKPQFKISQRTNMDSLSIYELLFHLVSWTLATESSWALDWCTWSTHASNVFKSQQNPTKQNYQKQTKYTFTESRRLNQAIMNQKTSEISNGQSALSYASKVIPKVHSSYFKFFSEKDKIMAIPYFHSIFSSDCQQS